MLLQPLLGGCALLRGTLVELRDRMRLEKEGIISWMETRKEEERKDREKKARTKKNFSVKAKSYAIEKEKAKNRKTAEKKVS